MSDVIGLVLPFFRMIFIGFVAARITRQSLDALGWMNIFIIYVALPALFFELLAKTLPTATNVFVIVQQYDVWVQRASPVC